MKHEREKELLRADAQMDQESASLQELARRNLEAWQMLGEKMQLCDPSLLTDDDSRVLIRLSAFGYSVINGRLLQRPV